MEPALSVTVSLNVNINVNVNCELIQRRIMKHLYCV